MRSKDPRVSLAVLDEAISDYQRYSSQLTRYSVHLRWWIARYSRGDSLKDLRDAFGVLAQKVAVSARDAREEYGSNYLLFGYQPTDLGMFRDALVLLSMAACLRAPTEQARLLVDACERGDALIEKLVEAAYSDSIAPVTTRAFPEEFDGLYAALDANPAQQPAVIGDYLGVWLDGRMREFGFKISQEKLGYWCFEAAGIVATLGIDDASFAADVHYPRDLVAFHRGGR
jgi:hypothetical protein